MCTHQHHDHQQQLQRQRTTSGRRVCRIAALVTVGALISAVALVGARATPPAHAAQRTPQPARAPLAAVMTETAKVTLPETSIAGPAFSVLITRIAWTGTDAAHHLNVATGTDGLHFPTKTTLPETSFTSPAVIGDMGPGSAIAIAWTGTDANHSLNVLPLTESTSGAGSVILVPGQKTVLRQFSSDAGPSLGETLAGALVLGRIGARDAATQPRHLHRRCEFHDRAGQRPAPDQRQRPAVRPTGRQPVL